MVDWCCMKIEGKLSVLIFFKPNKLALSQNVMQDEFYGQLEQLENSRDTGEIFKLRDLPTCYLPCLKYVSRVDAYR